MWKYPAPPRGSCNAERAAGAGCAVIRCGGGHSGLIQHERADYYGFHYGALAEPDASRLGGDVKRIDLARSLAPIQCTEDEE